MRMSEVTANDALTLRFERLVAPWREDLYRYAFWLCRDPHLADDVVQETGRALPVVFRFWFA